MMQKMSIFDLSRLKCPAEQYEAESCFSDFSTELAASLMHETERKFVHGLIRFLKPRRILEIGVWHGGGTAVLLNAIRDFKNSEVISIDLLKKAGEKTVGYFAKKHFKKNKNWQLFAGKEPSEIIEKIGYKPFDFCIIDTAHVHPIESLNFLTIFPFLNDNAVVVFHDLVLFAAVSKRYPKNVTHHTSLASKLLFDCLCGTKLKVKDKKYLEDLSSIIENKGASQVSTSGNIGAIQITKDTKKNIQNVFSMLMFPWGLLPAIEHLRSISNIVKKYYSKENFNEFCNAIKLNLRFITNGYSYIDKNIKLLENAQNIIFYGAGLNCKKLLCALKCTKNRKPCEIWDINPSIKSIRGIQVRQPDFISKKYNDFIVVITIGNQDIVKEVKNKLSNCNFSKILHFNEFYPYLFLKDKTWL
jgi:predicted O-methyltransferase YrrM